MCFLAFMLLGLCSYTDIKERVVKIKELFCFLIAALLWLVFSFLSREFIRPESYLPETVVRLFQLWEESFFDRPSLLAFITGILPGTGLYICSRLFRGGIGEGDAWLFMLTGLMLGVRVNVLMLMLGLLLSAVYAGYLLLVKKRGRKESFPFIPFLFLAYIILFTAALRS
ncbi:MAG TPA: prepilin peptidase [Lachnospiraceae bacterium]|nr:prepilin peptidase [Lachnospiraceae bacterium]